MRTRTRSTVTSLTGLKNQTYVRVYDPPSSLPPVKTVAISKIVRTITDRSESITDSIQARPEVYIDPLTQKWKRIRYPNSKYEFSIDGASRLLGKYRTFRPVQPCTHTKTVYDLKDSNREFVVVCGNHVSNWTNEFSLTYANPYIAIPDLIGGSTTDMATIFDSAGKSYSAGSYKEIDWFSLSASFTEACESFCKDKFLSGEALYEIGIFADAFKFIVNPSSALPSLLKAILKAPSSHQKKFRKSTLGQYARFIKGFGKDAIDKHLSYDFAVKPAIDEVKKTIAAHEFVSARLNYLRQNSGSFLPIRVRQSLDAGVVNAPPASLAPGVRSTIKAMCEHKLTIGCISGWGRVREDLDWNDTWSAYLQYFGVGKLFGLAWELIPGSFLLDWVTNCQERINHYTRLRTGGPFMGIRGVSASLKKVTREKLVLVPGYNPTLQCPITNPVSPVAVGYRDISTYSRYSEIPQTSGLVDFSNLGSFHYTKLAELIVQLWVK